MSDKCGRHNGYRDDRYRLDERPPEQEFETSGEIGRQRPAWGSKARGGYAGRGPKDYQRSDHRVREQLHHADTGTRSGVGSAARNGAL